MAISVFTKAVTAAATLPDDGVDLGANGWKRIVLDIASSPSGSVGLYVSATLDGTYRPVLDPIGVATAPVAQVALADSSVVANGASIAFPGGYQFVKPYNTSGVAGSIITYQIICSD